MTKETTTKKTGWTEEETKQLLQLWTPEKDALPKPEKQAAVAEIARIMDKPNKSITGKLISEKVYTAMSYTAKNGKPPVKKEQYAATIAKCLRLSEPDETSVSNANKSALEKISQALVDNVPADYMENGITERKAIYVQNISSHLLLTDKESDSLFSVHLLVLKAISESLAEVDSFETDEESDEWEEETVDFENNGVENETL